MSSRTPFLGGSDSPLISGDLLVDALTYAVLFAFVIGAMMVVANMLLATGTLQANKQ